VPDPAFQVQTQAYDLDLAGQGPYNSVYLRNLLFYQRASANSRTGTGGNLEDPVMVPRINASGIKN